MTHQQFNSEEGQRLLMFEHEYNRILDSAGFYTKGAAKLADRIQKLKDKIEKLYPSPSSK